VATTPSERPVVLCPDGPLGLVENRVVSPRTGQLVRLVVALAWQPNRFLLVPPEWITEDGGRWMVDRGLSDQGPGTRDQGPGASAEEPGATVHRPPSTVHVVRLSRTRAEALALALPLHRRTADGWLRPVPWEPVPEPPAHQPDDAALAEAVRAALAADSLTADGAIEVAVEHGVATLTGRVRTAAGAFQARKLALEVPGVWHVENDTLADESLLVQIRQRHLVEPALAAAHIAVEVDLGRVTLRGTVPDPEAARLAVELARSIPGVSTVTAHFD